MQEQKNQGLYYNCDDKFVPGHRCKTKKFLILLIDDLPEPPPFPSATLELLDSEETQPSSTNDQPEVVHFQLSQAALRGTPSPRTLRVQGKVGKLTVTILIDSGSSHNIMQPRIAEFLALPMVPLAPFSVIVGNGDSIQCFGSCPKVKVTLADHIFTIPSYILPIHGADLVLGVQWLQTIEVFLSDYSVPSIQFTYNHKPITLTGSHSVTPTHTSYAQFCRLLFTDSIASMHTVTVNSIPENTASFDTFKLHPSVAALLHEFLRVFSTSQGLPPPRPHDHHIHLLPKKGHVNVRPYRYPQYQKEVMSTIIKEMLQEGIIKLSTSPFSSPMILVKKKDDSWRFCVDYRALNAITVKDKFPIPTVDEQLDESHGSKVFSKLELRSGYHQVLLAPKDTFKTAFLMVDGHFEFLVMPFGLSNAPSSFQSTMNDVFRSFLLHFVLIFFDDVLVYSKDWASQLGHLRLTLQVLAKHQFFAKFSKSEFGVNQVAYLGHVISYEGVAADEFKLLAIQNWAIPSSIRVTSKVFRFHGLLSSLCQKLCRHCTSPYRAAQKQCISVV